MKSVMKLTLAASLATTGMTMAAAPAQAQVAGIATSSPEAVIFGSQARIDAYRQIDTAYATQLQQISTLRQEGRTLTQGLDTDGDNNVSQAEADAQPAVLQQLEQKQAQIETIEGPIALAQLYVIEQLLERYNTAQQQVITAKSIQVMLTPDVFQYGAEQADVTSDILAALNTAVPTVSVNPPTTYRPRRQTAQVHQAVNELRLLTAQRAAAAQQQAQGTQPAAPAQQPTGR